MLDLAREASALATSRSRAELETDRLFQLALERLLELIGEAASQIAPAERANHPQVPWSGITRFRNRLIHGYDVIDYDIVWAVANDDLPPLIQQIELILADRPPGT
ncbi:MAG TPA: HepT-like ribonuclease domain-containing protein [Armatimonadota bacterium]|nr:HepT-like ribonuclease domain-containing protein [Armatimonadota bacterium]